MPGSNTGYKNIEDYGIIGDLNRVALVGVDGSIDFMCAPDFDSPSIFAGLLDCRKGGHFIISPVGHPGRNKRLYLPDTNVLLTRFLSEQGIAEVSDFMPIEESGEGRFTLVRRAKTVRGEVRFRMVCQPRFDYARASHRVERDSQGILFISEGVVVLGSPKGVRPTGNARFRYPFSHSRP